MARHADPTGQRTRPGARRRVRALLPLLAVGVLLIGAVVLGVWWWNLRSVTDPIDADPVDAYATVVSSPPCSTGDRTTVQISGQQPPVTATLSGCGFAADQRLAVQYLSGHPEQVRLAGTTIAGGTGLGGKLLPLGILAAGLVAVLAAITLLVDRRRSRHVAAGNRVTVADLRSRADAAASPGLATVTSTARRADSTGELGQPAVADRLPASPSTPDLDAPLDVGVPAGGDWGVAPGSPDMPVPDLARIDPGEPAHVLPSGFVIVDEQLFTHSGTNATADTDDAAR